MSTLPTDVDFNSHARTIQMKVDIFLDGDQQPPLSITRDNYLVDLSLLEEATSGDTPFDNVTSNEITLTLHNPAGMFNPTNTASPYYQKLRRGVTVIPSVRTRDDQSWYQLGKFYITDWTSATTSSVATVIANDALYDVFGQSPLDYQAKKDLPVHTFLAEYFAHFHIEPQIDPVEKTLPVAYIEQENKDFLTELSSAYLLSCNFSHSGVLHIRKLSRSAQLRAVLSDNDQVLSIDTKLSINNDYDATQLTYFVPVESDNDVLLSVPQNALAPGMNKMSFELNKFPLIQLKYIAALSDSALCTMESVTNTSKTIECTCQNTGPLGVSDVEIRVVGTYLNKLSNTLGQQGKNTLNIENRYIQDKTYANSYIALLSKFVAGTIPVLNVKIRGNPCLEIGDKVRVASARYGVDFTGILMRQNFTYNGGLSSEITLLNTDLLEVVK